MHSIGQYRILLILFLVVGFYCQAQNDSTWLKPYKSDLKDFSLFGVEDKVSITSQTPLLVKDAPGTVTTISEDDIQAIGARDLSDVLRTIPGIEFYMDVQGVVGIGCRGFAANESIVILIDGIEMNELLYGSNQFGNHFPIDQIRRIEIVRGPGSVIYGGFAVHAVINIMTKSSEWYNGIRIGQTIGQTDRGLARRNFSGSVAKIWEKAKFSFTTNLAEGNRSDRRYTDLNGNSYDMLRYSAIASRFAAFSFRTGNFYLKGNGDYYELAVRDNQTAISQKAYPLIFSSFNVESKYVLRFGTDLIVSPYLNFKRQVPWRTPPGIDSVDQDKVIVYDVVAYRSLAGLSLNWKPTRNLDMLLTANSSVDVANDRFYPDSANESAQYTCQTVFGQGIWKMKYANVIAGLRFDYHSYFKPFVSPRIAVNKSIGKCYLKASYNKSFRTPAMANIALRLDDVLEPQITNYYEAEFGYNPSSKLAISLNAYQIRVKNGIVFSVLEDGISEGYSNAGKMGTQGVEAECKLTLKGLLLHGGYSFYTTRGLQTYQAFEMPGKDLNLALPGHKITLQSRYKFSDRFRLSNTFLYLSNRYGYTGDGETNEYSSYGGVFQWNFFFQASDVYIKGFSVGAGVYDITNSRYNYIQAYRSGHRPLPAMSREYVLKITYNVNLIHN